MAILFVKIEANQLIELIREYLLKHGSLDFFVLMASEGEQQYWMKN